MGKAFGTSAILLVAIVATPFSLALFGGGSAPPAMTSISEPFAEIDFSDLPEPRTLEARDGTALAYRRYPADGDLAVLALHGSSAEGRSLHALARALADRGIEVFVPDIRGHGESGARGDIAYMGQLEDDIADFIGHMRNARPDAGIALLGFSSGGGLALRYAGKRAAAGDLERLVMVSPMLGIDSPPYTDPNPHARDGEWTRPFVPRIIGLSILNAVGIHAFDHLPVIAFAVDPDAEATARYSHRLLSSMNPRDYESLLEATPCPVTLLAGDRDEVFTAASYETAVHAVRPEAEVRLIEGIGHVGMTLEPEALDAVARALLQDGE